MVKPQQCLTSAFSMEENPAVPYFVFLNNIHPTCTLAVPYFGILKYVSPKLNLILAF